MSSNFCTQCGARLSGPARFCIHCGSPVTSSSEAASQDPSSRERLPAADPATPEPAPATAGGSAARPSQPVASNPQLGGQTPNASRPPIHTKPPPAGSSVRRPDPAGTSIPNFAPPPVAQGPTPSPQGPSAGRSAMDSLMALAPGLAIQLFQNGSHYLANPATAARFLLPCLLSVVSMALAPKLGKWVAVLVILPTLAYMLIPLISGLSGEGGVSGMVQTHAGRGLVSMSMFYMLMNLLRSRRR